MGLGVLEVRSMRHVPGTATLDDLDPITAAKNKNATSTSHLYKNKNGIILVPQPTDDPRDPLTWPLWHRTLICVVLCILSVIASTLSPLLAANTLTLTFYFKKSFTKIALLTGYHLLGVGIAGFLSIPSARIWGKRHLYLLGTILIIISSAWGGGSGHNYNSLMAARFFQGVALAPFEALVNASVGELFFVHERGVPMAMSNLCLFGGAFFTPVIVGKMTDSIGWWWTFYFIAIFSAAMLPLVVFFCPETTFERPEQESRLKMDEGARSSNEESQELKDVAETTPPRDESLDQENLKPIPHSETTTLHPPIHALPLLSTTNLSLFSHRHDSTPFLELLLRPLPLFLHPGILWSCLIQGALIGWTVLIGIVLAAIMLGAPLWFNEVKTGYMYTGAFIGALLGFILAGILSDPAIKLMTRWNGGIYEPEFRMVLVIPMLIFGCAGLYGFGITANNTWKYGWFWPDFFFALEVLGMVLGAVASALYIADAHAEIAVEGFTCLLVFKNIFSFGLTFSGYDWLVHAGIKTPFIAVASVQVGICMLTVPMYIFGKKNRAFFARHDILKVCRVRLPSWKKK